MTVGINQDLDPVRRGDTIEFEVTVTDRVTGAAVDLSTYSIWCTGKRALADTDANAVFQVTKAAGDITVGGSANNVIAVTIPPSATVDFTANVRLFYDVQVQSVAGKISTVAQGMMSVVLDVTRTT